MASSSRTKPWSRTRIVPSGITSVAMATGGTVARLYDGTSGFSYASWKPDFYPAGTKPSEFLRLYAERLPSVELNATFYQLPSEERLEGWAAQVPEEFRFALKASQKITHIKRLKEAGDETRFLLESAHKLGSRLGPPSRLRNSSGSGREPPRLSALR